MAPDTRERPSPAALKDATLLRQQCYIDGRWADADSKATRDVHNPATGARVGSTPVMGAAETRRAIDAADKAWPAWRDKTARERSAIIRKWAELQLAHADDLALILTTEQGKPLAESKAEITIGAAYTEWFAEEARRVYGDVIPTIGNDRRLIVIKQPVGVCAAITPWNFPSSMITRKVSPALAAGCTVVIKPAEATPFSALALAELAARAGFPPGVLNVVTGKASAIGGEMTSNPTVRKLSFTGSTAVGESSWSRWRPRSRRSRSSWAATRRSSSSTMPTSTRQPTARSSRSTATPDRPASAPTACSCTSGSTTPSPTSSRNECARSRSAPAPNRESRRDR
jgi:succinate-semialdehyde dehydrogenase/glutarate-semialdehyde dehydrogenase